MRVRCAILLAVAFLFCGVSFAQDAVSSKIAIRLADSDYELTRFGNNFTGGKNTRSNFRFQTGVQFRF